MVSSADEGRVLVLLLDTSAGMWEQLRRHDAQKSSAELPQLGKASFVQQVLLFLNTYLMLQEGNKATVFAVDGSGSHLVHKPPLSLGQSRAKQHATQSAAEEVLQKLLLHMQASLPGQASAPCWSAALSRALCYIHKQQQSTSTASTEGSKPRILCITGSPDVPAQYIATMNAIFSAQRHGIIIDTCMVDRQDSAFLQQAAHISEGLYLRPKHTGALLQYLLFFAWTAALLVPHKVMCRAQESTLGLLASAIRKLLTWAMSALCACPSSVRNFQSAPHVALLSMLLSQLLRQHALHRLNCCSFCINATAQLQALDICRHCFLDAAGNLVYKVVRPLPDEAVAAVLRVLWELSQHPGWPALRQCLASGCPAKASMLLLYDLYSGCMTIALCTECMTVLINKQESN